MSSAVIAFARIDTPGVMGAISVAADEGAAALRFQRPSAAGGPQKSKYAAPAHTPASMTIAQFKHWSITLRVRAWRRRGMARIFTKLSIGFRLMPIRIRSTIVDRHSSATPRSVRTG
jgi:hypothetical protein